MLGGDTPSIQIPSSSNWGVASKALESRKSRNLAAATRKPIWVSVYIRRVINFSQQPMARTSTIFGRLALGIAGLGLAFSAQAQQLQYTPAVVTGFNADVVANGNGAATVSTTHPVDRDRPGARYCFLTADFVNSIGQSPTSWLPLNGIIPSASNAGLTFQLASYDRDNSLRIDSVGRGALHFDAPTPANILYLLVCSGNGASTVDVTVTFADSTTQAFPNQFIDDWFGGTNYAIQGVSRVSRETDLIQSSSIDPRLYQVPLFLAPANQAKPVAYIRFDKQIAPAVFNVMAVTVAAPVTGLAAEETTTTFTAAPNPATDFLSVQVPPTTATPVYLLDLAGRTLLQTTARAGAAAFRVGNLPAGVYVVRCGERVLRLVKE